MKCNGSNVGAFLLLILASSSLYGEGIQATSSTETQETGLAGGKTTTLSRYRDLAATAYQEFQKADYQNAARVSGLLEMLWDNSPETLKGQSEDIRATTDAAMDRFIDPLKGFREKTPDPKVVQVAYEAYISQLEKTDWPLVPDNSLDVLKTTSGVLCVKIKQGNGRQPRLGDIVVLRSTGLLEDGEEFRHSPEDGSPGWYWLLPGRQPLGLIEAMSLLHVGDSAVIVIPAALGYGPKGGFNGTVPPDASLTYVVDLLDVKSEDVAASMAEIIRVGGSNGVEKAIEQYRAWQRRGFSDQHTDEKQMNGLGYNLLTKGDNEGAIKIFKLNVEAYPQSANAHDSLGEAYVKNRDERDAIEEYRRALAIDPKMESSVKALQALENK